MSLSRSLVASEAAGADIVNVELALAKLTSEVISIYGCVGAVRGEWSEVSWKLRGMFESEGV
jgi:hypothetical protein